MILVWTPESLADRRAIHFHIRKDNPRAANAMDQLFGAVAESLAATPHIGRPGLIEGTRELIPHKSYRVVYEIERDVVRILALVHTARQWPPKSGS